MTDVYEKLAKHLNTLPGGFPPTDTGVELRILKRLFTPEEADIAAGLTMMTEPVPGIAARLGKDPEALGKTLEEMAGKGLIVRSTKGGENKYMAAQFVVGIWEYQVNRLTRELVEDFNRISHEHTQAKVRKSLEQHVPLPRLEVSLESETKQAGKQRGAAEEEILTVLKRLGKL